MDSLIQTITSDKHIKLRDAAGSQPLPPLQGLAYVPGLKSITTFIYPYSETLRDTTVYTSNWKAVSDSFKRSDLQKLKWPRVES